MPQGAPLQRLRVGRAVSGHFRISVTLMNVVYSAMVKASKIGITISHAIGVRAKIMGIPPRTNAHTIAELKFSTRRPTPHVGQGNSSRCALKIEMVDRHEGQSGRTQ